VSVREDNASLAALSARARASGRLALDTEFMGEGRYRTLLCLVQLAVPDDGHGQHIAIVDPLQDGIDGSALATVVGDPEVQLVLHAGRQDVALLRRWLSVEVRTVFDTQVAAGFAGMSAQSSYESLLVEMLGVRLRKSASFTRWDARPLTSEQLGYAREDVVHLLALADELERRLAELGRLQWAREECEQLERVSDGRDLDSVFMRLPRIRALGATAQAVARELVHWREETAARQDRPVQSVLGDAPLVEIAKRSPTSTRQLGEIRGVQQSGMRRSGAELLQAVERGRSRPLTQLAPEHRPAPPDPSDAPLVALCEALARSRAVEAGLAYELLAARADLQAIVAGARLGIEANVRTLGGWRRELVGRELLELLDGRVSLTVRERRVRTG
jgi:ribonuclease D